MAHGCALFPTYLSSCPFTSCDFVFFVPICFLLLPVPFFSLMHRKCVSSGVYQACALRTVPDSMSQVGSGRLKFCAVGVMSVVSVRARVEAYMYGLQICLYCTDGAVLRKLGEWRKIVHLNVGPSMLKT